MGRGLLDYYVMLRSEFDWSPFYVREASYRLGVPKERLLRVLDRLVDEGLAGIVFGKQGGLGFFLRPLPPTRRGFRRLVSGVYRFSAKFLEENNDLWWLPAMIYYHRMLIDAGRTGLLEAYKLLIRDGYSPLEAYKALRNLGAKEKDVLEGFWDRLVRCVREDTDSKRCLLLILDKLKETHPKLSENLQRLYAEDSYTTVAREWFNKTIILLDSIALTGVNPSLTGWAFRSILEKSNRRIGLENPSVADKYTPRRIAELIVELAEPKPGQHILDPALGTGGLLVETYLYVKTRHGDEEAGSLYFYGQDIDEAIIAVAEANLRIHGISNYELATGNSLLNPAFTPETWDIVLAHLPLHGGQEVEEKKLEKLNKTYQYGVPSREAMEWAWIQLMLAAAKPNGKAIALVDRSSLSRDSGAREIRSNIVEKDLVETVILLPRRTLYHGSGQPAIILLDKNKPAEKRNRILFINATSEYKTINIYIGGKPVETNLLKKTGIERIARAHRDFIEIDGFTRIVDLDEVRARNYSLDPIRYIIQLEPPSKKDLEKLYNVIKTLAGFAMKKQSETLETIKKIIEAYDDEEQ